MFKKSIPPQIDMFKDVSVHLSKRKTAMLEDPTSWQNVFYREVTMRVDESVFEPLFNKGGRPNASLRILLAMMVLKEGNGWSDKQLFGSCRFDLRCMKALGLQHMDDDIPVESTYYKFRQLLTDHDHVHGHDLVGAAFRTAVGEQIKAYDIKGERIRMDSKLIQSNIAKSGRLDLILETVRVSVIDLGLDGLSDTLSKEDMELLEFLKTRTVTNLTYPLDNQEKKALLIRMGHVIKALLPYCSEDSLLHRLYREQYKESDRVDLNDQEPKGSTDEIVPREPKEISSDSLQSVHDPEAAYRCKGQGNSQQRVSGYHANLTETCSGENPFELVTDVRTVAANICEDAFLQPAIEGSNEVMGTEGTGTDTVKHVTTDGGYDSLANRETMANQDTPHWNMALHKGMKHRYEISRDRDGSLTIYCKKTSSYCEVTLTPKGDKHIIHHSDGSKRYMTEDQVETYLRLQSHKASQSEADMNIRPNVESTIHQAFHRLLKRNKVKYRGMCKCHMYSISRAYWCNFRRILKNELEISLVLLFSLFGRWEHLFGVRKSINFGEFGQKIWMRKFSSRQR